MFFYDENSWMKGKQTVQLRHKAEGQYLLHMFRLCVMSYDNKILLSTACRKMD